MVKAFSTIIANNDINANLIKEKTLKLFPTSDGRFLTSKCREVFENQLNSQVLRRNEHGEYVLPCIQNSWAGWEECWKNLKIT